VLDFDHTLFNTTLYVQALREALEQKGIAPEIFDEKRNELKSCCALVDIDRFVEALPLPDKDCLHRAIHDLIRERAREFVFTDAQQFIDRHRDSYDIVILTQGDQELQSEKVEHSNLSGYHEVIISLDTKDESIVAVATHYDEVHYIDDKAKHIDEVKERYPHVITYFIQRPEDKPYASTSSQCDCANYIITDLSMTIS